MSWKDKSNMVIKRAIEENYTVGDDIEQLFNLISKKYYPFGERKRHPYKAWLNAIKEYKEFFIKIYGGGTL